MSRPMSSSSSLQSLHAAASDSTETRQFLNNSTTTTKSTDRTASLLAILRSHARLLLLLATAALVIALVSLGRLSSTVPSAIGYSFPKQTPLQSDETGLLNYTKVATILEPRMSPVLIPLLVSYLSIMPSDWPFVVWCSNDNYLQLSQSAALSRQIQSGRLNLTILPSHVDIHNGEYLSRFLTKPWFYSQFHPEAEWMFFFQNDATLCAASEQTVDDWLGYDWVGSPTLWTPSHGHGGNGGLGIRRISTMQRVTSDPDYVRMDWNGETEADDVLHENAEDYWFMTAIDRALGAAAMWPERDNRNQNEFSVVANSASLRPLGVHKGHGPMGLFGDAGIEEDPESAMKRLLHYCPELSLIIDEEDGRFG